MTSPAARSTPPFARVAVSASAEAESEPSAVTLLPIRDEPRWEARQTFTAEPKAIRYARMQTRTRLTLACWIGDVETAARVAGVLVDNAVRHSGACDTDVLTLHLAVLATGEATIEVIDPLPRFSDFAEALGWEPSKGSGERRSLWWVQRHAGRVSFAPSGDSTAKTVQVLLSPRSTSA